MLSYQRSALSGPAIVAGRTRMATMRLFVDGFARFLSRKAIWATAAVGAIALVALAAFSWRGRAAAPPAEAIVHPARVAVVQYRTHMRSLMLAGTVVPRI